jgi:hypothetical protein
MGAITSMTPSLSSSLWQAPSPCFGQRLRQSFTELSRYEGCELTSSLSQHSRNLHAVQSPGHSHLRGRGDCVFHALYHVACWHRACDCGHLPCDPKLLCWRTTIKTGWGHLGRCHQYLPCRVRSRVLLGVCLEHTFVTRAWIRNEPIHGHLYSRNTLVLARTSEYRESGL